MYEDLLYSRILNKQSVLYARILNKQSRVQYKWREDGLRFIDNHRNTFLKEQPFADWINYMYICADMFLFGTCSIHCATLLKYGCAILIWSLFQSLYISAHLTLQICGCLRTRWPVNSRLTSGKTKLIQYRIRILFSAVSLPFNTEGE